MRVLEHQERIAAKSMSAANSLDPQRKIPLIVEVKGSGGSKRPVRRSRRKLGADQPDFGDL